MISNIVDIMSKLLTNEWNVSTTTSVEVFHGTIELWYSQCHIIEEVYINIDINNSFLALYDENHNIFYNETFWWNPRGSQTPDPIRFWWRKLQSDPAPTILTGFWFGFESVFDLFGYEFSLKSVYSHIRSTVLSDRFEKKKTYSYFF